MTSDSTRVNESFPMNVCMINPFLVLVFGLSIIFPGCTSGKENKPQLDIRIIKVDTDFPKKISIYDEIDSGYCCSDVMNYFNDGLEFTVQVIVGPELDDKLIVILNYFNHLKSPVSHFVAFSNDSIGYICDNALAQPWGLKSWAYHINLKSGVHEFKLRMKFKDCVMDDGFLTFRLRVYGEDIDVRSTVFVFLVKNGKVAEIPIRNFPQELEYRIGRYYELHNDPFIY